MSRDIKFRAWSVMEQKMYLDVGINPLSDDYHVFNKGGAIVDAWSSQPCLMQFTGLKDKNGVEIYEGDIIKNNENDMDVIVFTGGRFTNKKDFNDWFVCDCEIIGNIHENPELLND